MRRTEERRYKSVLGLWILTVGLVVSPLVHIVMEHGHSHSHGAASHSHGVPLAPTHQHAPWSVEHFLALFIVGAAVVLQRLVVRALVLLARVASDPRVSLLGLVPAMPQGP